MEKSLSPNGKDYISCPRSEAPILGIYVKIYKFWKECLDVYQKGELGVYIVYGRILYEAFTKMTYLTIYKDFALREFRLTSYKNRINAYKKTKNIIDDVNLVRNIKLLDNLNADGFTIEDLKVTSSKSFKTISELVDKTYTQEEKDLIYTLIYGLSSDAIHSDWGEILQIHLNDNGNGMMTPNINEKKYNHYRIILPIADIVSQSIKSFISYVNDIKTIIYVGDDLISMAAEIQRILRLIFEHIKDEYEKIPDKYLTI